MAVDVVPKQDSKLFEPGVEAKCTPIVKIVPGKREAGGMKVYVNGEKLPLFGDPEWKLERTSSGYMVFTGSMIAEFATQEEVEAEKGE